MKVPVLSYHSAKIDGPAYAENEHVAFARDLRLIDDLGLRVIPLARLVDRIRSGKSDAPELERAVALTLDDGIDFDYHDLDHPACGPQRSMLNIMRDFIAERGRSAQPTLHATSFVVASPAARDEIARQCLAGLRWYNDDWWAPAVASGLMAIANHSWDHNHACVSQVAQRNQEKGNFHVIDSYQDADVQIRRAKEYLDAKAPNEGTALFAYPYGEANVFLSDDYLPHFAHEHGQIAAFATVPDFVTSRSSIWRLPRFVSATDWRAPEELATILERSLTA